MHGGDLTKWQLDRITKSIDPTRKYLSKLCQRCEKMLLPSDPLYIAAHQARDALQSLAVNLHYLRCDGGVGQSPRPTK